MSLPKDLRVEISKSERFHEICHQLLSLRFQVRPERDSDPSTRHLLGAQEAMHGVGLSDDGQTVPKLYYRLC